MSEQDFQSGQNAFHVGQEVAVDAEYASGYHAKVLYQSERRVYTKIETMDGEEITIMTCRLTPLTSVHK